jgi:hypothetical protein
MPKYIAEMTIKGLNNAGKVIKNCNEPILMASF